VQFHTLWTTPNNVQSSDEHADILTNLEAAQKHLDFINTGYLHALDSLPSALTSSLETAPPPQPATIAAAISTASATEVITVVKDKKLRAKHLPKGVVVGVTPPPDPERWLKKSERSTFGQGGKRRKGAGGGATQGFVESPASQPAGQGAKASGKSKKKK
jgi:signal recognition particle subunit SRP72